jgi:hypothetical protein
VLYQSRVSFRNSRSLTIRQNGELRARPRVEQGGFETTDLLRATEAPLTAWILTDDSRGVPEVYYPRVLLNVTVQLMERLHDPGER